MEATKYSHKLPVGGWGAYLGHHVPVEMTMKYWHVQEKILTCCCSGLCTVIQSQGSISFCDDPIRSRYRSHSIRQRGELQLQHHRGHATGDDTSRRSRDPDTRRAGTLELRCGSAASMSRHHHPGRSNFGHSSHKLFFFFREMTAFFRGPTSNFRRLENSNNFQRNDNFFQNLIMYCSGANHLILGTFLLPIFRYPLPRPKMDFLIRAARSRSSRGPAKYAQIFSKQAQKFRRQTQIFRTHTTIFRT
jgi:hypothetical protein